MADGIYRHIYEGEARHIVPDLEKAGILASPDLFNVAIRGGEITSVQGKNISSLLSPYDPDTKIIVKGPTRVGGQ